MSGVEVHQVRSFKAFPQGEPQGAGLIPLAPRPFQHLLSARMSHLRFQWCNGTIVAQAASSEFAGRPWFAESLPLCGD